MTPALTASPLHDWFAAQGAEFWERGGRQEPLRVRGVGAEYEAARQSLALADGADRALIHMQGTDLLDFLQRTLSSDLLKLEVGAGQWSALLDGKGHMLADLLLFRLPDSADGSAHLLADCPAEQRDLLLQRVDMLHFGEQLSWAPVEAARLLMLGPQSGAGEFGATAVPEAPEGCWWLDRPDRGAVCRELVGPADFVQTAAQRLLEAGGVPTGWVALDILRIEAARPWWGIDFDAESILPETGDWHRASLAKGCYAGQEVVAKVDTYGEAPRQLCRLDFGEVQQPLVGAELQDEAGQRVGHVTSWAWSPLADRAIGLGIIKRKALQAEAPLRAVSGEEAVMCRWTRPDNEPDRQS